ncbi:MAG: hypothetical protein Q4D20_10730, partial [Clostridia bacterium]|nr:hypothetical protein [Clostridia bacterium]
GTDGFVLQADFSFCMIVKNKSHSAKAASVSDILIFPRKSKFVHQMRRTESELLGTFVSIDKSTPSGAVGCRFKDKTCG